MGDKRITMEIFHREGLARIGRFGTDHGTVQTPNIMPVINPNLTSVPIEKMIKLGTQAIITNSYIIRRNDDLREKALSQGLHRMIGFDGTIMTDSGTFQSYVYGNVEYGNRDTVEFQLKIGSDISTILDIFSTPSDSKEKARDAVKETNKRLEEVGDLLNVNNISGPVQGSIYMDQRELSSKYMADSDATYIPIGGVVPLLEQYNYSTLVDIIMTSKLNSNFSKPVHLFGGGHPMFMAMAVLMGVDMFDSASYIKYARDDRFLYPDGTRHLSDLSELPYWSPLRDKYSMQELQKMKDDDRILLIAEHNLFAIFQELSEIRERIRENTLWQYVEGKSRAHPALYSAFRRLLTYSKKIEPYVELYRKSSVFHFGQDTNDNPYGERLKRISGLKNNMKPTPAWVWKPARMSRKFVEETYEQTQDNFSIDWFGLKVPIEFEESYPVEQVIYDHYEDTHDKKTSIKETTSGKVRDFNLEKVRSLSEFQFGLGTGKLIFPDDCKITISRNTGRIRTISKNGNILASMRTHDGYLALTMNGAEILHSITGGLSNRVKVTSESAGFNKQGKSVFFKFVIDHDKSIIAYNDVLVVDPEDKLIAVGRATVSGREIGQYREGVAVIINHHAR